jgi:hypothetical protein
MTVTAPVPADVLPIGPSTDDPDNFDTEADAFVTAQRPFGIQMNALGQNVYANALDAAASATTAQAQANAAIAAVGAAPWVSGTTYTIGNERYSLINLQSYRRKTNGAGTADPLIDTTNWAPVSTIGVADEVVSVSGSNGYGSTNTKILQFTTVNQAVGTAITFASSAAAGASFTINEAGLYEVCFVATTTAGSQSQVGVSLNSAQLTGGIQGITPLATRFINGTIAAIGNFLPMTRTSRFAAGDVLRPHTDGVGSVSGDCIFTIRKVGNV